MPSSNEKPGPTCVVSECENEPARAGRCWTHIKRKQRECAEMTPVRGYGMRITELTLQRALRYADAEEDAEFEKAKKRLLELRAPWFMKRKAGKDRNVHRPPDTESQG